MTIPGVHFVTDTQGHKVAVLLDRKEWGVLWEDIYDSHVACERAGDPVEPWETVRERLQKGSKK